MLVITPSLESNMVEIKVTGALNHHDFKELAQKIDPLINRFGSLKLFVDATHFTGWDNSQAAEQHFRFVKEHHKKIDKIAVISGHAWQHWLISVIKIFIHPEIKIFSDHQFPEARNWLQT
jgi:hypothetical protein